MTLFANVPTRRFGVEVEFVGVSCEVAARAITAAGFSCQYEGYNHNTSSTWKIVRDGSIEYHNGNCGELVSPRFPARLALSRFVPSCEHLLRLALPLIGRVVFMFTLTLTILA